MLIYIATPFTSPSATVRAANFARANRFAAWAMLQGHTVFSPISHSVPVAEYLPSELLLSHEFWQSQDQPLLRLCQEIWICPPDAALTSRGVAAEVKEANRLGLPIRYVDESEFTPCP